MPWKKETQQRKGAQECWRGGCSVRQGGQTRHTEKGISKPGRKRRTWLTSEGTGTKEEKTARAKAIKLGGCLARSRNSKGVSVASAKGAKKRMMEGLREVARMGRDTGLTGPYKSLCKPRL